MTPRAIIDTVATFTPYDEQLLRDPPIQVRSPSLYGAVAPDDLIAAMDAAGVSQSIIPARCYGHHWRVPYDLLAEFIAIHPTRLFATAGIDANDRTSGVRAFTRAITELGFVGAHTYSAWSGIAADDRLYYPYYAKAEELDVPVQIECYRNSHGPISCMPSHIARIAFDFPGLKIVAIHAGWPWTADLVAVARGHENVYIGCDIAPERWDPALRDFIRGGGIGSSYVGQSFFGRTITDTSTRVVFGTNGNQDISVARRTIDTLGLPDDSVERLMLTNARALYKLPNSQTQKRSSHETFTE